MRWSRVLIALAGVAAGALITLALVSFGTSVARRPGPLSSANIQETFTIDFSASPASKERYIAVLQSLLATHPVRNAGVQIRPDYEPPVPAASAVSDASFTSALDDARRKATLLAKHAGASLAGAESIAEGFGGQPPPSHFGTALNGMSNVVQRDPRLQAYGPVVLAVTYRLAGGGSGTISVLGYGAQQPARPAPASRRLAPRIAVAVNAQGKDLGEAGNNLAPYEGLIRRAAANVGVPDSAIAKSDVTLDAH